MTSEHFFKWAWLKIKPSSWHYRLVESSTCKRCFFCFPPSSSKIPGAKFLMELLLWPFADLRQANELNNLSREWETLYGWETDKKSLASITSYNLFVSWQAVRKESQDNGFRTFGWWPVSCGQQWRQWVSWNSGDDFWGTLWYLLATKNECTGEGGKEVLPWMWEVMRWGVYSIRIPVANGWKGTMISVETIQKYFCSQPLMEWPNSFASPPERPCLWTSLAHCWCTGHRDREKMSLKRSD